MSPDLAHENKKNSAVVVALISLAGTITAALIGAAAIYWRDKPPKPQPAFVICIKVESWNPQGRQPIKGSTVQLDLKGYRNTTTTDNVGCASFEIPDSLRGQRGTISVTTAEGKTKTINQDIRDSVMSIIFYPND